MVSLAKPTLIRAALTAALVGAAFSVSASPAVQDTIGLDIDASDVHHQVFSVRESLPVKGSGEVRLLYPQWDAAGHAPTGVVADLAGLRVTAGGQALAWRRDSRNPYAFLVSVPDNVHRIELTFDVLSESRAGLLRPEMMVVPWQRAVLYPAGVDVRDLSVAATVKMPGPLTAFTALSFKSDGAENLTFATTSLHRLLDSPVYAARYTKRFPIGSISSSPVFLDVLSDDEKTAGPSPNQLERMKGLVSQTAKVFGGAPFKHYDAIATLSDVLAPGGSAGGAEHLEEGENNLPADFFSSEKTQINNADLIAHELVHAWNGLARVPADLHSGDYNSPLSGSLLWVYEGQTEFWGRVLAARANLRDRQNTLNKLANDAAAVANPTGRQWKDLEDSTNDAVYMAKHHIEWRDYQRREDYYTEGVLLWLDVDARLRELTHGKRGIDDFARQFFAADRAKSQPTYTFDDVCQALNNVAADDWASFLNTHLHTHESSEALAGLARAGWTLSYTDTASEAFLQDEKESDVSNLDYSLGMQVSPDGRVESVMWQGPAFRAGLAPGHTLEQVNGKPFTPGGLLAAVAASGQTPVVLRVRSFGHAETTTVDYRGGLRYPHLVRVPGTPDRLSELLKAR